MALLLLVGMKMIGATSNTSLHPRTCRSEAKAGASAGSGSWGSLDTTTEALFESCARLASEYREMFLLNALDS